MGIFRRNTPSTPADPAMVELGREYAIAKRHGDRKASNRITRRLGSGDFSDSDRAAFDQGRDAYDAIPPITPIRRNNHRKGH